MSAFGGDALQRKAISHKSSFIIIDYGWYYKAPLNQNVLYAMAKRKQPR